MKIINKIVNKILIKGYGLEYPAYIICKKAIFYKGLYNSKFSIEGIYHTKFEREFLNYKKFEYNGVIVIRLGKLIFVYNRNGYLDNFKNMTIIE